MYARELECYQHELNYRVYEHALKTLPLDEWRNSLVDLQRGALVEMGHITNLWNALSAQLPDPMRRKIAIAEAARRTAEREAKA